MALFNTLAASHAYRLRHKFPQLALNTVRSVFSTADQAHWQNPAAVLHGVDDLRFEDFPLPQKLQDGEVRVELKAVGICGSDVHYLKKGRIADFVVTKPMVIGHESAGVVAEVGAGVTGLREGDPVALEPGIPCWHNRASREGRYNLCPDIKFFATPPYHGSLCKYVDHPASFCFKLPSGVTLEEGALCEPLSVGIHACRRGRVQPGKSVAILGAGPIGLVALLAANAFGADQIAITDLKADNLAFATSLGASTTLQPSKAQSPDEVAAALRAALPPYGPDIVIDCAGFEQTVQTAVKAVSAGGVVVLVGMGHDEVRVPTASVAIREVDICGSFRYMNTYSLCLNLLHTKRVDALPLITHRFGFSAESIAAGFDTAVRAEETKAIKVMFNYDHAS